MYVCFLDASKAFDRINHWHLFNKLLFRGLPHVIVRLLVYWYTSQSFVVRWCNRVSSCFKTCNGVRQGGILSPVLFNVFMDDLSQQLGKIHIGCFRGDVCINHLFYADDAVLLAPSPSALQNLLNICEQFALEFEMVYNTKKTVCMVILPKKFTKLRVPYIYLYGKPLRQVAEQKYLGVFISSKQSDTRDLKRQMCAIYARGNMLIQKFRKCSTDVKIQIFKSYCNVYCGQLWSKYPDYAYRSVKVAYNNICRSLFCIDRRQSISRFFVENNMNNFDVMLRKAVFGFRERVYLSFNSVLMACISSTFFIYGSAISAKWYSILF
jgi:hypothetical protein